MEIEKLPISGIELCKFAEFEDDRGSFSEIFNSVDFNVVQVNRSISKQGVLRGIHFADVPPGQAKYVTCLTGAILDVMVDLRKTSPTFKKWISVKLDASSNTALSIPVGIGHAFLALEDRSTVVYLCDQRYNPKSERAMNPFDQTIGIEWPSGFDFNLSDKDSNAPSFEELFPNLPN